MITFTKRDCLDSFEFFIEGFEFRRPQYNFHTLLGIFMKDLESDIQKGYNTQEQEEVKKFIKQAIYKRFGRINFNEFYDRKEIEKIIFGKRSDKQ